MKKLLLIAASLFVLYSVQAQFTIQQNLGSKATLISVKGGLKIDSVFVPAAFADTTAANTFPVVKYYPGNIIRTVDDVWMRNYNATAWVKISFGGAAGTGTVTDFSAGDLSPLFTTSEATTTTTPALSFSLNTQNANKVFAGPATGADAAPTFRLLVADDIPDLSTIYLTNITGLVTAGTNVTVTGTGTSGDPYVINSTGGGGSNIATASLTANGDYLQNWNNKNFFFDSVDNYDVNSGILNSTVQFSKLGGKSLAAGYAIYTQADNTNWSTIDITNYTVGAGGSSVYMGAENGGRYSEFFVKGQGFFINPHLGNIVIDTLLNLSTQNVLMGWTTTAGGDRGEVGYITAGTGITISAGVISNSGTITETDPLSIHLTGTSTLTGNVTVAHGSNSFTFSRGNDFLTIGEGNGDILDFYAENTTTANKNIFAEAATTNTDAHLQIITTYTGVADQAMLSMSATSSETYSQLAFNNSAVNYMRMSYDNSSGEYYGFIQADKFFIKDGSIGTASVGDVWTLLNTTTGEGEWATPTGGGFTNLTQFVSQNNWKTFYSNGSGDVQELSIGASGTVLTSNGTSSAPSWQTVSGTGTVTDFIFTDANGFDGTVTNSTTTPTLSLTTTVADDRIMFSNSGALAGSANLTWDGAKVSVTGTNSVLISHDASTHALIVNADNPAWPSTVIPIEQVVIHNPATTGTSAQAMIGFKVVVNGSGLDTTIGWVGLTSYSYSTASLPGLVTYMENDSNGVALLANNPNGSIKFYVGPFYDPPSIHMSIEGANIKTWANNNYQYSGGGYLLYSAIFGDNTNLYFQDADSKGLVINKMFESASASSSYVPINFVVPTTGLIGQFLATNNNYSNAGVNLPANSIGLLAETESLSFIAGVAGKDIRFTAGGYAPANEIMRIKSTGVSVFLTSSTAKLHIAGGSATANTAPLKINSGTLLGTTEAGAIENDGTHLYYTAANGGTRYQLDQQSVGGGLTVGTSTIASGTDTKVLFDNSGVLGEYTISGSGNVVMTNSASLTTPKIDQINDANANELFIFTSTASAVNELTYANAATGNNPLWTATGGDADVGIAWKPKAAGKFQFLATTSGPAETRYFEDADNGTNYAGVIAPATLGSDITITLPNASSTLPIFGQQITFSGPTAARTVTFPDANFTAARTDAAQTFTGSQTFSQVLTTNNAITAVGNAATVPVTSRVNTVTNNSAATLTITLTTASAVDGQEVVVRILDASAAAQTITWVNTENSSIAAPTTSNGSTTLPLEVVFRFNTATTKWRTKSFN